MADLDLRVDYQDDILDSSVNTKRKYNIIENEDGTKSLEDVSVYTQNGDSFGAADINKTNQAVLDLNDSLALALTYNENTDYFGLTHNGEWKNVLFAGFQTYYLYANGNEFTEKTGDWISDGYSIQSYIQIGGTVSKTDNYISLSVEDTPTVNQRKGLIIGTKNKVNLSNHSKLCITYDWGTEERYLEVDISSISSSYISLFMDNDYFNEGHVIKFYVACSNTKENVLDTILKDASLVQNYSTNLLNVNVKKVWLE